MEKKIFEVLVDISRKDFVDFKDVSGVSNRDQRIYEHEKYRKLNYLEENGFVSKTNEIYTTTEYGYMVAQYKSWTEYLQHQKELLNRKIAKENNDLKISEFQVRTTYLPYYISIISFLFSVFVFVYTMVKDVDKDSDSVQDKKYTNSKIIENGKQTNTILTTKAIDSSKPKSLLKP